jgi:hypothetical protein
MSLRRAAEMYDDGSDHVHRNMYYYWDKKVRLPGRFHPDSHGGRRNFKLTIEEHLVVQAQLYCGFRRKPDRDLLNVANALTYFVNHSLRPSTNARLQAEGRALLPDEVSLNRRDIYAIFKLWGWSAKVPVRIHLNKFRPDNIERYINYSVAITWFDPMRLKYLDEATYCHRGPCPDPRPIVCCSSF